MEESLRLWLEGFSCGACHIETRSVRRAGVLVILQDPGHDPEILPFCYKHAGIYVGRWAEPAKLDSVRDAFSELVRTARGLILALISAALRALRLRK